MLKGHTKIELTDVVSGEVTTVEDDNLVTNIIQEIFNTQLGVLNANPWKLAHDRTIATIWDTIHNFFQGLFLFDTSIVDDPDIFYPPSGVRLVGCGSNVAYTSSNLMVGSYNSSESGVINDGKGFKYVWDFATNQANGQISCACLTSLKGGRLTPGSFPYASDYTGNGFTSEKNSFKIFDREMTVPLQEDSTSGNATLILHINAEKNELIYACKNAETQQVTHVSSTSFKNTFLYKKSLTLARMRFPVSEISLFDTPSGYDWNENEIIEKVEVSMPQGLKDALDPILSQDTSFNVRATTPFDDGEYIYIPIFVPQTTGYKNTIEIDEVFYIWKIKIDDFSSTYYTVTNTTGEPLECTGHSSISNPYYNYILVTKDYTIAIGSTTGTFYMIDNNDSTNVTPVKFPDGTNMTSSSMLEFAFYDYFTNKIYFSFADHACVQVVDLDLKEGRVVNVTPSAWAFNIATNAYPLVFRRIKGSIALACLTTYDTTFQASIYPAFLSTINNLQTSVTKTQAQTMKVIYTITKAVDEEV